MQHEIPPALGHWLYVSHSTVAPAWAVRTVDALVEEAIVRNANLALTGALLFTGSRFVQALEGPEIALAATRAAICRDPRHADVLTLAEGPLAQRRFAQWSLAYAGRSLYLARQVEDAMALADCGPALFGLLQAFTRTTPPSDQ